LKFDFLENITPPKYIIEITPSATYFKYFTTYFVTITPSATYLHAFYTYFTRFTKELYMKPSKAKKTPIQSQVFSEPEKTQQPKIISHALVQTDEGWVVHTYESVEPTTVSEPESKLWALERLLSILEKQIHED